MHILFLTDNFPPEVNAPASRTYDHCRVWSKLGHRVTVITCVPNFPKGMVFPGYRNRLWQREMIDGIEVIRVWSYITANEGFLKRVLDYQSFMIAAVCASLFVRGADAVIGTSPQFFTACAGHAVGFLKRIPFVFELRDIWPESIKAVGAMKSTLVVNALERLEIYLYRKATRIVAVTNAFRQVLIRRGIDGEKIDVVTNGVDLSRFRPLARDKALADQLGLTGKFVVGYVGTHGMAHALETLIAAADRLRDRAVAFIFVGDGARKSSLQEQARDLALDNVVFVDTVPKEQVARYWSLLDVSVIHLRKTELFTTVIPSKIFECMGMGIPILLGVEGEAAEIVTRERIGELFEPENENSLCAAIENLVANPDLRMQYTQNGVRAASDYDRANLAQRMLESIQRSVKPKEQKF